MLRWSLILCFALVALVPEGLAWAKERVAVIWLHGHPGSNRSPKPRRLQRLLNKKIQILSPDLNKPSQYGLKVSKDAYTVSRAMKVVDKLIEQHKLDKVVLAGHSFGGYVAANVASRSKHKSKIKALTLLAPAFNTPTKKIEGQARRDMELAKHPAFPLVKGMPITIHHGSADTAVPLKASQSFKTHQKSKGGTVPRLRTITGGDHIIRDKGQEKALLADFAKQIHKAFGLTPKASAKSGKR